ncbi:alanine--tRNA ligase, mitochondrial isoform X1 [Polypterus senegalus]|uniref:alanine--tRNA ligase, mitochondrial isoform X1 n=1 Tax=Polypterus senegalus TaxID=55291 RepID=UPI00196415A3|nr:alanine--tRNA ligase, mitochondrial isoform X1 [Polypterus senegalus]
MALYMRRAQVLHKLLKRRYLHTVFGIRDKCDFSSGTGDAEFTSKKVRDMFTDFFKDKYGHTFVPSSPVKPRGDPTLLFVNAGMNQFKPVFLGTVDPRSEMAHYRRVVNSQKCVRAGGKHNDLEDVGKDVYHHTFFEMLGNWSFGDYFKEKACLMAWELLTSVYGIPKDRLYVTYFGGDPILGIKSDDETREIWLSLGVQSDHILPFGSKDNFWEMGESGPCGPCTEIHYDHIGSRNAGMFVNRDSPDVVEIWNIVFMQYKRELDGSLRVLPRHNVDTGMGLERLVTILQGKRSNYDTDLFTPILSAIHEFSKVQPYRGLVGEADVENVDMAYRVLADHVRTLAVCIADGIYPGMSGAEFVLRRILRRAVRFSMEVLKAPQGTLAALIPTVTEVLGDAYPELAQETSRIMELINDNEEAFVSSLHQGRRIIDRTLQRMDKSCKFPADVAWSLHRNLGFPLDLIGLMLSEKSIALDTDALEKLSSESAKQNAQSHLSETETCYQLDLHTLAELKRRGVPATDDSPKYQYSLEGADKYVFHSCQGQVLALYAENSLVEKVSEGQRCGIILDRTCFYAEQGGQTHDRGYFLRGEQQDVLFPVENVQSCGGYVVHEVIVPETLCLGDSVHLFLDEPRRLGCMVNHTSTHVLNFALRRVLGDGVEQRGSHVTEEHLRFDFSTKAALTIEQLQKIEQEVEALLLQNDPVYSLEVPLSRAKTIRRLRTVDEVYPDPVRVVSIGIPVESLLSSMAGNPSSVELCCGTHLLRTGVIKDFVIVSDRQLVKGITRIVAVTGDQAKEARETGHKLAQDVDSLLFRLQSEIAILVDAQQLSKEVGLLTDVLENTAIPQWQKRELQKKLKALQRTTNTAVRKQENKEATKKVQELLTRHASDSLVVDSVTVDSISILMKMVNILCDHFPGAFVMLLSLQDSGSILCACQVPKNATSTLSAADWALAVCRTMNGSAGGSDIVAKGTAYSKNLDAVQKWALEYANNKLQK